MIVPVRILHVFPSFAAGGAQMRMCALANHFGGYFSHAIVALDGDTSCRDRLAPGLDISFPKPPSAKVALPLRLRAIARTLRALRPDLLITSNWGSIEWAMANRLGVGIRHIHTEDGFGADERDRQIPRRVLTRRIVLRGSVTIVPSRTLHDVATRIWHLPIRNLYYIPNGIDLVRFTPAATPPQSLIVGCVAALRPEKNLGRLIRACATAQRTIGFRLAILGDGPERAALETLAAARGADVSFLGARRDAAPFYRDISTFALSSDTEQMPLSVMEAMASGLPVVATRVGDIAGMVAADNQPFLVERSDDAMASALIALLADADRQQKVGAANRTRAVRDFDFETMATRWAALMEPSARLTGS